MKKLLKHTLVTALLYMASVSLSAQAPSGAPPPGGPSGTPAPTCWPPPCIPVDGGISFLIAIGAAFGGKKAFDHFKSEEKIEG